MGFRYFAELSQRTNTKLWINNPSEVEVRRALEAGAVSCTINPAYCSKLVSSDSEYFSSLADKVIAEYPDPELAAVVLCQEFNLVPELTLAENIFIGGEPRRLAGLLTNYPELDARASEVLQRLETDIAPRAWVKDLSVAERQTVEIAKALSVEAKLIIMDEPTASLTDKEVRSLFSVVKKLRDDGVSIIYISHRLEEAFELSNRIAVPRDGKMIGAGPRTAREVLFEGTPVDIRSSKQAIRLGIGYVTDDRKETGIFPEMSLLENVTITVLKWLTLVRGVFVDDDQEEDRSDTCAEDCALGRYDSEALCLPCQPTVFTDNQTAALEKASLQPGISVVNLLNVAVGQADS